MRNAMVIKQSTVTITIMFEIPIILHIKKIRCNAQHKCFEPCTQHWHCPLWSNRAKAVQLMCQNLCQKSFSSVKHILCHAMHLYRLLVVKPSLGAVVSFCGSSLRLFLCPCQYEREKACMRNSQSPAACVNMCINISCVLKVTYGQNHL